MGLWTFICTISNKRLNNSSDWQEPGIISAYILYIDTFCSLHGHIKQTIGKQRGERRIKDIILASFWGGKKIKIKITGKAWNKIPCQKHI